MPAGVAAGTLFGMFHAPMMRPRGLGAIYRVAAVTAAVTAPAWADPVDVQRERDRRHTPSWQDEPCAQGCPYGEAEPVVLQPNDRAPPSRRPAAARPRRTPSRIAP